MADSTIPATIDALVTRLPASLTQVAVHDGPAVEASWPDHLSIGWDGDNPEVVEFDQAPADIRPGHSRTEVFFIRCVINAGTGETMKARRARAFAILAGVAAHLRADLTLGGVVTTAQVTDGALLQDSSQEDGLTAAVRFRIRCKSRI